MYRLALAAFLTTATSASAGDQSSSAHTHIGQHKIPGSSFNAPINYRPYGSTGFVRSPGYDPADTRKIDTCQGALFDRCETPLLKAARNSDDPTRSVISVEEF